MSSYSGEVSVDFNPKYVLLSIGISFMGSYVCTALYLQYRLCSKENKSKLFTPNILLLLMSCSYGVISLWCMHFIAMNGLSLRNYENKILNISYRLDLILISVFIVIIPFFISLYINATDKASQKDKKQQIKQYIEDLKLKSINEIRNMKNKKSIILKSLLINLHKVLFGGILGGTSIFLMHFLGFYSMIFEGIIIYNSGFIILSIFISFIITTVSYWILFRVLALYPFIEMLRVLNAITMSIAMNSVYYITFKSIKFQYIKSHNMDYLSSNLVNQNLIFETSLTIGIVGVFLFLILTIADLRTWYINLSDLVELVEAEAIVCKKDLEKYQRSLDDQPFLREWFKLREDNNSLTGNGSYKSSQVRQKSSQVNEDSYMKKSYNSVYKPSLIRLELTNRNIQVVPEEENIEFSTPDMGNSVDSIENLVLSNTITTVTGDNNV